MCKSKDTPKDSEMTAVSHFSPGTLLLGAYGASLFKNSVQQYLVISGKWEPMQYTRIGAFAGAIRFPSGTVGSGTATSIQLIHSIFGGAGECTIGNFFNSRIIQRFMEKPIGNAYYNRLVAKGERRFWCNNMCIGFTKLKGGEIGSKAFGELFGGVAGFAAIVPVRMAIVQWLASAPKYGAPHSIMLLTGAIGGGLVFCEVKKTYEIFKGVSPGE